MKREIVRIIVGLTHGFQVGLGPVIMGKTPNGNYRIVSDRDICYDGKVVVKSGDGIPHYDLHDKTGNFTPVLDLRNGYARGHNFDQSKLTSEFEVWVEIIV